MYPLFHIYWLENFLDDGCHDLFSLFLTTNQHFVVAMQKLQFHYGYSDILCHNIGQNTKTLTFNESCWFFIPCIDMGTKSARRSLKQRRRFLQPGYTQIHQIPGIINHVFVTFGNGWFIFGWSITRKFWRGCPGKHWRTHFHSNNPNMRCIQWMIYSQVKCWSWFTATIFWRFVCRFHFFLKLVFFLKLDDALKIQLRIMNKRQTTVIMFGCWVW
jgi:hypothetical protein